MTCTCGHDLDHHQWEDFAIMQGLKCQESTCDCILKRDPRQSALDIDVPRNPLVNANDFGGAR